MIDPSSTDRFQLAATVAPVIEDATSGDAVRTALERLAALGYRAVQLSATQAGFRPRDLDRSARRDLLAMLRRRGLELGGMDAWIPVDHFGDPARGDRAEAALKQIIDLAADLGRCTVSTQFPGAGSGGGGSGGGGGGAGILDHAERMGVTIADHAVPVADGGRAGVYGPGIDPAAWLSHGLDPVAGVHQHAARLKSARLTDLLRSGMRGPVGSPQESRLDVMSYRIALSLTDMRAPIVVDARQWTDPWGGLRQTVDVWERSLLPG